jgi:hypothetical protein
MASNFKVANAAGESGVSTKDVDNQNAHMG